MRYITERVLNIAYVIRTEKFNIVNSLTFYFSNLLVGRLNLFMQLVSSENIPINSDYNEIYINNFNNMLLYLFKINTTYLAKLFMSLRKQDRSKLDPRYIFAINHAIGNEQNKLMISYMTNEKEVPLVKSMKDNWVIILNEYINNNLILFGYIQDLWNEESFNYACINNILMNCIKTENKESIMKKDIMKRNLNCLPYTLHNLQI
jgi:hypothetical protein